MYQRRTQSWPESSTSFQKIPCILVTNNGSQTENSVSDHEEKNNHWVMNKLKVLSQYLLDYNRRTFGKFMQDIEREYREQINMNKRLRCENEDLKMQLLEAEKELAFMKSSSIY